MATINALKLSELELKKRIDAEFYSPEYVNSIKKMKRLECKRIGQCCFVTSGSTPPDRDPELRSGILLLKTANIREGYIDITSESPFFIDDSLDKRLRSSRLKPNDVLINIVGATLEVIGRVAMVPEDFPRANITQAMSLIRLITNDYLPEYIFAFLHSKYGRMQVCRIARPTAQYNLNHEETKSIIVPKMPKDFQNQIKEIYHKFYDFYRESISLYFRAENLLLEELRLQDFKPEFERSYAASLSRILVFHRADAEYFQPIYDRLVESLRLKFETIKLKNVAPRKKIKINPDPEKIYKYIEIGDISTDIGEINYTERLGNKLPPNARIPIHGEEFLISKVRPTRGAIGIIPHEMNDNVICSSAFSVFEVPSPWREYLYIITRSVIGRLQMERPTTGTSYPTINDNDVENIEIPVLPNRIRQKIAFFVQQCYETRKKAKNSLEEAKRKVEEAIEKAHS